MAQKKKNTKLLKAEKEKLAPVYDEAVKKVNALLDKSAGNLGEIGKFLLDKFFDGDTDAAKAKAPNKEMSLRRLAGHPEIDCSYSTLSRAVDVAVMKEEFSSVAALQQLSASHLVVLSALEDHEMMGTYAELAAKEKLSSRKLREKLVEEGAIAVRGRGALVQNWEKDLATHHLLGVYRACGTIKSIDIAKGTTVGKTAAKKALEEAESARDNLNAIIKELKERAK